MKGAILRNSLRALDGFISVLRQRVSFPARCVERDDRCQIYAIASGFLPVVVIWFGGSDNLFR